LGFGPEGNQEFIRCAGEGLGADRERAIL
jgi:hypothetical protein